MRARLLLPFVAVPALLLAFAGPDDHEEVSPSNHASLEKVMDGLKSNLKVLARTITSPEGDAESLGYLTAMQEWALKGKDLKPANLEDFPLDEQDAHIAAFRIDMLKLMIELSEMEIEVLEGRNEAANERLRGPLLKLRDQAHEEFQSH